MRSTETLFPLAIPIVLVLCPLCSRCLAQQSPPPDLSAAEFVRDALNAEAEGRPDERQQLLEQAISVDADCAPAQWQLGKLKVDGAWLTATEYQNALSQDFKYLQYLALSAQMVHDVNSHLAAAKWCRRNRLADEERFHWRTVLSFDPHHKEAQRALGLRWSGGELLTHDQARHRQAAIEQHKHDFELWSVKFRQIVTELNRNIDDSLKLDVLKELANVDADGCVGAIEAELLARDAPLESAAVSILARIENPESTELLVRIAVGSDYSNARQLAIDALKERKLHTYAPQLLEALQNPYESDFRVNFDQLNNIQYHHELTRETPNRHEVVYLFGNSRPDRPMSGYLPEIMLQSQTPLIIQNRPRREGYASFAHRQFCRFAEFGTRVENAVRTANQHIAQVNIRVRNVLAQVVGHDHGPKPTDWWRWWNTYNELTLPNLKPTELQPTKVYMASCFPIGTKVWTKRGNIPIESVNPGDFVFSQDIATGEIALKPVLATTLRDASGTINFRVNHETICATRGHPMWVTGDGWRMIKLVEVGSRIRTIKGSVVVERVEEGESAPAFNLIVDEYHNYFVGDSAVLVHDNTYRTPTKSTVPGLQ